MLIEALCQTVAIIENLGLTYALIGGLAVLKYGGRTTTVDADVTLAAGLEGVKNLLREVRQCGWHPDPNEAETAIERGMIRWWIGEVRVDVVLAQIEFQKRLIRDAKLDDVFGYPIRFARLEDLVLLKLLADRPVDRRDVEELVDLHGEQLDRRRLRRWARGLGVEEKVNALLPHRRGRRGGR